MSESKSKVQITSPIGQIEQAYPLDEILANTQALFGVRAEVVSGALHDNTKKELTVGEVRQAVNSFMKRGAK